MFEEFDLIDQHWMLAIESCEARPEIV